MKYSIYTWAFGNEYERLPEVLDKDPNAEYIVITDNKEFYDNRFQYGDTWQVVYESALEHMDEYKKFMYCLCHSFKYCSNDIVIKYNINV
jgi:hypothetical protein